MADGLNYPDIYSTDQWYIPLTSGSILWLVRNTSSCSWRRLVWALGNEYSAALGIYSLVNRHHIQASSDDF